ncbi:MAG TPA: carboxypeptidase M32 [Chloroflexota bacterium]|jgi:carboxypeptidase Taq|nr:carboxypeptidase M32 [Chloroflexota bacterium]
MTLTRESIADALAELRGASAELYDVMRAIELLGWDQETMMPPKGVSPRALQQATLTGVYHERLTQPRLGDLLKRLTEPAADPRCGLNDVDRALIREMRRAHEREVKIPARLVKELARATSEAQATWVRARAEADWSLFRDDLARIMALKRQVAEHVGYAGEPYDALLDEYEPGARAEPLRALFADLRRETVDLIGRIQRAGRPVDRSLLEQEYDLDKQWWLSEESLRWIGFDLEAGRLDRSAHPFASHFAPTDVRLTTRLNPRDFGQGFFGTLHEGGHGLYEQGIGEAVQRSLIGGGVSLGVHESQSRMWENLVGRGLPFWRFALPKVAEVFPEQLGGVDVESFWRAVNHVQPSPIRVEADEVTYDLHVVLRFELESALFSGQLEVDDLPAAWNEKMRELLGIVSENDSVGVLQDIHWAFGLVGYFPTYTLGNVYAAQLWDAIGRDLPDRDALIERGELAPILAWLRERIHRHGGTYLPEELIRRATGGPPSAQHLVRYLNEKYTAVYGLAARP